MTQRARLIDEWVLRYGERRQEGVYDAEDFKTIHNNVRLLEQLRAGDLSAVVSKFLNFGKDDLDAPRGLKYAKLRDYLSNADLRSLGASHVTYTPQPGLIILDDRRDSNKTSRMWDSDGPGPHGYLRYPPSGDSVHVKEYILPDLLRRLSEKRKDLGIEKRTIYFANMTSSCIIAIICTASSRSLPILKNFFYQHLLFRPLFHVSMASMFRLEFHIPYLALRLGPEIDDAREIGNRCLREYYLLPLSRPGDEIAHYYESQVSFLITGVDEWLWTSYCSVDTFFKSEENSRKEYIEDPTSLRDAAAGGSIWLNYPVWHPIQYFLIVISRRMTQASEELSALTNLYVDRLNHYEKGFETFDDENLTRTHELSSAIASLRKFRDLLRHITEVWEEFYVKNSSIFVAPGNTALRQKWDGYIAKVEDSITAMKADHRLMSQKLELFNSMRDGLVNASALRESSEATLQGRNIGILTNITILYLPLSFATSFFGMDFIPSTPWLWIAYAGLAAITIAATTYLARRPQALTRLFRIRRNVNASALRS